TRSGSPRRPARRWAGRSCSRARGPRSSSIPLRSRSCARGACAPAYVSPSEHGGPMKPVRVLVVDDAVFMRSMISEILTRTGRFEILAEAANGHEAVERFKELRPDLVTMDIVMPEMDGI